MKMKPEPSGHLQQIFAAAYRQVAQRANAPAIVAYFHPFADLTHTIRSRDSRVTAKVSYLLREAPLPVLQAVARLLWSRLLKRKSSADDQRLYQQFAAQTDVQANVEQSRRQREAKPPANPSGKVYDLRRLFARLNQRYFNNALPRPSLGWSLRPTKRLLGHHDYAHQAIVISRTLDDADVPPYVIEFLLYHEMLHLKHQPHAVNGRNHYHTAAFRSEEARFIHYDEAMDWLDEFARQQK